MFEKDFENCFGDERLDKRGKKLLNDLFRKGVHSIRQLAMNVAELKGWYRFLDNERTTEEAIISDMANRCSNNVRGKVVLCLQDTSDINLYHHKGRIKKDGFIGCTNAPETGLGFLIHPSLVVDASSCFPYGFADVQIWNRPQEKLTKYERKYDSLPIEQKESYKWIAACLRTKEVLQEAATVIIVQDREGDIYEQFATIPDEKTHLLIRASTNRTLLGGKKLFDELGSRKSAGTYSINIEGDKRKKQLKRKAIFEVRFCKIEVLKPVKASKQIAKTVQLYAVEAREINTSASQPVCWRIYTTLPVTNLTEALMIIEWYSWRWTIEEVFRIAKEEGFNIESSELESARKVRKLCLLMLQTIIKLFQMRISYDIGEDEELPADYCFSNEEQQCMELQSSALEGKTEKQKNPFKKQTMKWATWVIARLGGWKGYQSERPPGITTLWTGLRKFNDVKNGWELARNVSTR